MNFSMLATSTRFSVCCNISRSNCMKNATCDHMPFFLSFAFLSFFTSFFLTYVREHVLLF